MKEQPAIHLSTLDCAPQNDENFNKWFNEVHIPLLFKFKGLQEVNRYKILTNPSDQPQYLTTYTFTNRQAVNDFLVSQERKDAGKDAPAGITGRYTVQYELIKNVKR
jgi:uncharacterized protein (TIGR02118 family)